MRIRWIDREPRHWKLVVEPLNILMGLRALGDRWEADCLGQAKAFPVNLTEKQAKIAATHWFVSLLRRLETMGEQIAVELDKE